MHYFAIEHYKKATFRSRWDTGWQTLNHWHVFTDAHDRNRHEVSRRTYNSHGYGSDGSMRLIPGRTFFKLRVKLQKIGFYSYSTQRKGMAHKTKYSLDYLLVFLPVKKKCLSFTFGKRLWTSTSMRCLSQGVSEKMIIL